MEDLFQKLKRKSRKRSSTSSEEDNRPSEDKRSKVELPEEDCGIDEVHSVLEMAEDVLPKLDIVLKKLEAMETKLDNLGSYVKNVDAKVNALTTKVEILETTTRNAMKSIEELDRGLAFLNSEVEGLKKLEKDCAVLRQEVYQRRENLRFYGIEEDPEGAEDTRQVLIDFMESELGIDDASEIEFQRVHRIGPFNQQAPKPRQIIARFLRYRDRERAMSNARKLKGKNLEYLQTCLKKLLIEEKSCCQSFLLQRRRANRPILVGLSQINCLSMADYLLLRLVNQTMFFLFLFPF